MILCDLRLTLPLSVVDLHRARLQNGFDFRIRRAKVTTYHVLHARKRIFDFGDLSWPFMTWLWPWPVPSRILTLTGYLHYPFKVTLAEFRAEAIDIAGPWLHHTETSKFDLRPDLDPRVELNLKIWSMLWGDLVESFLMLPRGARYDYWFSR